MTTKAMGLRLRWEALAGEYSRAGCLAGALVQTFLALRVDLAEYLVQVLPHGSDADRRKAAWALLAATGPSGLRTHLLAEAIGDARVAGRDRLAARLVRLRWAEAMQVQEALDEAWRRQVQARDADC